MDCGLITNKPRGSYAKVPANRYACSNLGRSLRSDGPDQIGAWGGGGRSPETKLHGGAARGLAGSGVTYAARVVHLGPLRASGRFVAVLAKAAAALHGGASPARVFAWFWAWLRGAKRAQGLCAARASPCGTRAGLQKARHGEFTVRRRHCAGVPVFGCLGCFTNPNS